jgi:purine-binding chemotaxis protein CheW
MNVIAFTIVEKEYAMEIKHVVRVIRMKKTTPIPQAPDFVEGVITWHSKVVPLVSLRKKFNIEKQGSNKLDRIIITRVNNHYIGIAVDQVTDVLNFETENLEPPAALLMEARYLLGIVQIGGRLILLMDIEKLLSLQERSSIEDMNSRVEIRKKA